MVGRRERVVHRLVTVFVLVELKHRELSDPQHRVRVLGNHVVRLRDVLSNAIEGFVHQSLVPRREEHQIPGLGARGGDHRRRVRRRPFDQTLRTFERFPVIGDARERQTARARRERFVEHITLRFELRVRYFLIVVDDERLDGAVGLRERVGEDFELTSRQRVVERGHL